MKNFKQYLMELQDPIEFIKRASERYGTKEIHGEFWEPAPLGKHIPLANFDDEKSQEVMDRLFSVRWDIGGVEGQKRLEKLKTFDINKLIPTQPYNYTGDEQILRAKMENQDPAHISIVTHEGNDYIIDGHHSIMGARLRGDKTIVARHFNMDEHGE
jgi:hypothetical protein